MTHQRMLVSDIDGTLLKEGQPTPGLSTLKKRLKTSQNRTALVYATGRSQASTWRLIDNGVLPCPDAIAPLIGTEIWLPSWKGANPFYREVIRHHWNRDAVVYFAQRIPGLTLQPAEFQSPFKVSFFIEENHKIFNIQRLLDDAGIRSRIIYSCGRFLDVLPQKAGKRGAVQFLQKIWSIKPQNVLSCGDSGNDIDMLTDPNTQGIAVGNAQKEIRDIAHHGLFYSAKHHFAAGILEGAEKLGFLPTLAHPE